MRNSVQSLLQRKGTAVLTANPFEVVFDAVQRMNERHLSALPVVEDDELVGILTERDVLTRVVAADLDARVTWVSEVMTRSLLTIEANVSIERALGLMTESHLRHLPVIDRGRLTGIVSIGDIGRWIARERDTQIDDLMHYISGR
jgi:CBS domain-containing protein